MTSTIHHLPETAELKYRTALDKYDAGEHVEALSLARLLIDQGFAHACTLAGTILEKGGNGVPQDFQAARFYYERATQDVGALEAWLGLGRLYFFGYGVQRDLERAAQIYRIVNEDADHAVAQLMLGRIFAAPEYSAFNPTISRDYFRKAAEKGLVFAYAAWALLEWHQGRLFRSLLLRFKAGWSALLVTVKDRNSPRLRHC